jgi:hypothetical protein
LNRKEVDITMALLTPPVIERVDAWGTSTGTTPLDTDPAIEFPPEIMTWPITLQLRYVSYSGGDAYPTVVSTTVDEGDDVPTVLTAAYNTARGYFTAQGHTFP